MEKEDREYREMRCSKEQGRCGKIIKIRDDRRKRNGRRQSFPSKEEENKDEEEVGGLKRRTKEDWRRERI